MFYIDKKKISVRRNFRLTGSSPKHGDIILTLVTLDVPERYRISVLLLFKSEISHVKWISFHPCASSPKACIQA